MYIHTIYIHTKEQLPGGVKVVGGSNQGLLVLLVLFNFFKKQMCSYIIYSSKN